MLRQLDRPVNLAVDDEVLVPLDLALDDDPLPYRSGAFGRNAARWHAVRAAPVVG